MNDWGEEKKKYGRRRPKDHRHDIPAEELTAGEVNFCFPALFSDYAEWSGVELCTTRMQLLAKIGFIGSRWTLLCAPCCSREVCITRNEKVARKKEA